MKFFTGFTVFHLIGIGLMVCGHWLPGGQPTKLGATNLWQQYRNSKSPTVLVRAIIVFSIYAVLYGISLLLIPFSRKNFEMQLIAKKQ